MRYRVKPGDTLYEIAQRFGTTVQTLIDLNDIENPDMIEVGQIIIVPDRGVDRDFDRDIDRDVGRRVEVRTKNFDYTVVNGLLIVMFTNKDIYDPGENIRVTLVKTNITNSPIKLSYSSGQRIELVAYDSGRRIWTWSANRSFVQATKVITLEPGQSLVYKEIWNQDNNDNVGLDEGVYRIQGWNVAKELSDDRLDVFIRIEE
jgi:LysM repeat protein